MQTDEIKRKIKKLKIEIDELVASTQQIEMIDNANTLRDNEYLTKKIKLYDELVENYETYQGYLEKTISIILDMQSDLSALLKTLSKNTSR